MSVNYQRDSPKLVLLQAARAHVALDFLYRCVALSRRCMDALMTTSEGGLKTDGVPGMSPNGRCRGSSTGHQSLSTIRMALFLEFWPIGLSSTPCHMWNGRQPAPSRRPRYLRCGSVHWLDITDQSPSGCAARQPCIHLQYSVLTAPEEESFQTNCLRRASHQQERSWATSAPIDLSFTGV